jgi:hypothetical protein
MRTYTLNTSNRRNEPGTIEYWVTFTQQPLWNAFVAKVYHWYDMRMYKIPGVRLIERFGVWLHRKNDEIYIPWTNKQDLRCDDLRSKNLKRIASIQIDKDTYQKLQ